MRRERYRDVLHGIEGVHSEYEDLEGILVLVGISFGLSTILIRICVVDVFDLLHPDSKHHDYLFIIPHAARTIQLSERLL